MINKVTGRWRCAFDVKRWRASSAQSKTRFLVLGESLAAGLALASCLLHEVKLWLALEGGQQKIYGDIKATIQAGQADSSNSNAAGIINPLTVAAQKQITTKTFYGGLGFYLGV
jgi:hypothetical protein